MPIYEFKCEECGTSFSQIRKMGDDKEIPCTECGSKKTQKLISLFSSITSSPEPDCSGCMQSPGGCGFGECDPGGCGMH
jgi:putative FmdB family regulatory protein